MQGWISLHRNIWGNWTWEDKPFSRGQAWIDILLLANHEDGNTFMDGQLIKVARGEHITSETKLAERWGWSRTKVRNFLDLLTNDNMIENIKEGRKRTRLRVVNYNDYQDIKNNRRTTEEQEKDNRETTEEQQKNINNNDNNENNDNKEIYIKVQNNKNPKKNIYSEYVSMTEEEYQKLLDKHGEELTKKMIETLDNYKGSSGKKYKSDYRAILNWVEGKVLKEVNYKPSTVNKKTRFHTQEQRTAKYTPEELEAIARKRR